MKIAIISYWFYETTTPLSRYIALADHKVSLYHIVTKSFLSKNYDVDINSLRSGMYTGDHNLCELVKRNKEDLYKNIVFTLLVVEGISRINLPVMWWLKYLLLRSIMSGRFNVINIVGHHEFLDYLIKFLDRKLLVLTVHEIKNSRIPFEPRNDIIQRGVKKGVRFIFHSEYVYDCFKSHYSHEYSADQCHIVKFGLFLGFRNEYCRISGLKIVKKDSTLVVLYYGHIHPYKGVENLMSAARLLSVTNPEIKFIIAGKGKLTDDIPCNTIRINRFLKDGEISFLHLNSHITICPYLEASQSGIPMTSFLFGKPVVATDVGAFKEYVIDGKTGLLMNDASVDSIVSHVLKAKDLIRKGLLSFNDIRDETLRPDGPLHWETIAKKTIRVYKDS